MTRIGIFGTSGFAREVDDVASELGLVAVFVAENAAERDAWPHGEDVILEEEVERYADMPFVIGIGDTAMRKRVAERFLGRLRFATLVHPAATFGKRQRACIEERRGVVVGAGARFMSNVEVGDFAFFDLNSTVGHDSIVGSYAHLAPGANVSGHVDIGERAWVGTGAAVNQGEPGRRLAIGAGTVIGSGAVVVADCDADAVYAGVPARRIR